MWNSLDQYLKFQILWNGFHCVENWNLSFESSEYLTPKVLFPNSNLPNQLKSITFKEDPVPIETLEALILSCNKALCKIAIGYPGDRVQYGYSNILKLVSHHCPNLEELGAVIGIKELPEFFLILKNCRKLKNFRDIWKWIEDEC